MGNLVNVRKAEPSSWHLVDGTLSSTGALKNLVITWKSIIFKVPHQGQYSYTHWLNKTVPLIRPFQNLKTQICWQNTWQNLPHDASIYVDANNILLWIDCSYKGKIKKIFNNEAALSLNNGNFTTKLFTENTNA